MIANRGLSNCGTMELCHFGQLDPPFSYQYIASRLQQIDEPATLRHFNLVVFSGNRTQELWADRGPRHFAKWLRKQGEKQIRSTKEVRNRNTGRPIRLWTWIPSTKFRKKVQEEFRRLPPRPRYW